MNGDYNIICHAMSCMCSSKVHLEVYASLDCPMRELSEVQTALKAHTSGGGCDLHWITKYTKEDKVELKRCRIECASKEEAVGLAEELRHIPQVEMVSLVEAPKESVDYTCSIL